MTKKLVWRFSEKPSTQSLRELVLSGILTKEEAKDILFNEVEESERTIESYQQEIKFLREIIDKLSNRTQIVEVIKEVYKPYLQWTWTQPYYSFTTIPTITCSGGGDTTFFTGTDTTTNFSNIQTF